MNLSKQRVYVHLESSQLGDNIAWLPYIDLAREKYNWEVHTNFYYKDLFGDVYSNLNYGIPSSYDKIINIDVTNREKPLQWSAAHALGVDYVELRPRFNVSKLTKLSDKTITFSEFGSNYAKSWTNPYGWLRVIQYINLIGYTPVCVSKEVTTLTNIKDCTGNDLKTVCNLIYSSGVYIGVSSGLAWLAWCLGVPVIMLSGHTHSYFEFSDNCVRIGPPNDVCRGCYNNNMLEVKWEDMWCPSHKNTYRQHECTYSIEPNLVIDAIKNTIGLKSSLKI